MKVIIENAKEMKAFVQAVRDIEDAANKLSDRGQFDPANRLRGHAELLNESIVDNVKDEKSGK